MVIVDEDGNVELFKFEEQSEEEKERNQNVRKAFQKYKEEEERKKTFTFRFNFLKTPASLLLQNNLPLHLPLLLPPPPSSPLPPTQANEGVKLKGENGGELVNIGGPIEAVCFSEGGERMAVGGKEREVEVFGLIFKDGKEKGEKGEEISSTMSLQSLWKSKNVSKDKLGLEVPLWYKSLSFEPHSLERLVATTGYGQVRLFDTQKQRKPLSSHLLNKNKSHPHSNLPLLHLSIPSTTLNTCIPNQTRGKNDKQVKRKQKRAEREDLEEGEEEEGEEWGVASNSIGALFKFSLRRGKRIANFKGSVGACKTFEVHPSLPLLASSGLDRFLRIFQVKGSREQIYKLYVKQRINFLLFCSEKQFTQEEVIKLEKWEASRSQRKESKEGKETLLDKNLSLPYSKVKIEPVEEEEDPWKSLPKVRGEETEESMIEKGEGMEGGNEEENEEENDSSLSLHSPLHSPQQQSYEESGEEESGEKEEEERGEKEEEEMMESEERAPSKKKRKMTGGNSQDYNPPSSRKQTKLSLLRQKLRKQK